MSSVTHKQILKNEANYWRIEANHTHAQWERAMEELNKYYWRPINTAPFKQRVLVLFSDGKIGTMIFDDASDFKTTYAKYWITIPPLPNGLNS
jgi:hypothetical protein